MKKIFQKILKLLKIKKADIEVKGIKANNYGMINNFKYAIKTSWKYNRTFIITMMIFTLAGAFYQLIGVYIPKIVLELVSKDVKTQTMIQTIIVVGVIMLLLNYIKGKCEVIEEYGFDKIQYKLMGNYLNKVFHTDFKNMENPDFLDLTERARRATYYGQGFHGYCMRLSDLSYSLVVAVISGIPILLIHPLLVVVLCVISFLRYREFNNTTEWAKKEFRDAMSGNWRKHYYLAGSTRDFSFAKDIRLFGIANWIEHIWKDINVVFFKACKRHHNKWILSEVRMSTLRLIQNALLYIVLIYMVFNSGMSAANFVLYIGLISTFSLATDDLFGNMVWMNMNKLHMDDYRTFIDWEEDKPNLEKNEGTRTDIGLSEFEFTFENVSFKYPGHDKYVIKDLNIKIDAGMKLAIVGVNGAGKTTLTKLLMRLYEPTKGRILLNGTDIKEYDRSTYYKIFAPVFQNIEVFAFPIWENISMKKRENTDMDIVDYTIKRSGLDQKINTYEKGKETELLRIFDPEGVDLSGGERQRLAMARALYQNRDVIVLDEPTAALDALAEDKMYQEFHAMVKGKTSIFISHRLSSTRFCDKIVLFENGTVIEEGTHDELMKKGEKYAQMYHVQAQYYQKGGEVNA